MEEKTATLKDATLFYSIFIVFNAVIVFDVFCLHRLRCLHWKPRLSWVQKPPPSVVWFLHVLPSKTWIIPSSWTTWFLVEAVKANWLSKHTCCLQSHSHRPWSRVLEVKFHLPNTKEETHHWNRRVLFNGTVPRHPIFWQRFIPHDHVDSLVLVERNDVVCLTFQTIGDVHCLHQIIQRQWTLNEQRKNKISSMRILKRMFSSEVFEPKGSINKKIINRSNKFNQAMKSSHNQTTSIRAGWVSQTVQRCW